LDILHYLCLYIHRDKKSERCKKVEGQASKDWITIDMLSLLCSTNTQAWEHQTNQHADGPNIIRSMLDAETLMINMIDLQSDMCSRSLCVHTLHYFGAIPATLAVSIKGITLTKSINFNNLVLFCKEALKLVPNYTQKKQKLQSDGISLKQSHATICTANHGPVYSQPRAGALTKCAVSA
jgi:hypothetical protein